MSKKPPQSAGPRASTGRSAFSALADEIMRPARERAAAKPPQLSPLKPLKPAKPKPPPKRDPRVLSLAVQCKLGSIVVHLEEWLGPNGHAVDKLALTSLLDDRDVQDWLNEMRRLSLLPVKR